MLDETDWQSTPLETTAKETKYWGKYNNFLELFVYRAIEQIEKWIEDEDGSLFDRIKIIADLRSKQAYKDAELDIAEIYRAKRRGPGPWAARFIFHSEFNNETKRAEIAAAHKKKSAASYGKIRDSGSFFTDFTPHQDCRFPYYIPLKIYLENHKERKTRCSITDTSYEPSIKIAYSGVIKTSTIGNIQFHTVILKKTGYEYNKINSSTPEVDFPEDITTPCIRVFHDTGDLFPKYKNAKNPNDLFVDFCQRIEEKIKNLDLSNDDLVYPVVTEILYFFANFCPYDSGNKAIGEVLARGILNKSAIVNNSLPTNWDYLAITRSYEDFDKHLTGLVKQHGRPLLRSTLSSTVVIEKATQTQAYASYGTGDGASSNSIFQQQ